jgi:uncharacterized RDD family membrane protein YckC
LATRSQRLLAALVDGVIASAILYALEWKFGRVSPGHALAQRHEGLQQVAAWATVLAVEWLALHAYFLKRNAQTIGKRIVGIRIENRTDRQPTELWQIVFTRHMPLIVLVRIPTFGWLLGLVELLFIFRDDQRCLHDHLAGTVVAQVDKP